jgi:hypothetical protein
MRSMNTWGKILGRWQLHLSRRIMWYWSQILENVYFRVVVTVNSLQGISQESSELKADDLMVTLQHVTHFKMQDW